MYEKPKTLFYQYNARKMKHYSLFLAFLMIFHVNCIIRVISTSNDASFNLNSTSKHLDMNFFALNILFKCTLTFVPLFYGRSYSGICELEMREPINING